MNQTEELIIGPAEVEKAFLECLQEIGDLKEGEAPPNVILVEGVVDRYKFDPDRLELQRERVTKWLEALPIQFRKEGGGGWSFLNACNQENGIQWTGLHKRMEQLFCLAIGLKLAECLLPSEMWPDLPGGMPYYAVLVG